MPTKRELQDKVIKLESELGKIKRSLNQKFQIGDRALLQCVITEVTYEQGEVHYEIMDVDGHDFGWLVPEKRLEKQK